MIRGQFQLFITNIILISFFVKFIHFDTGMLIFSVYMIWIFANMFIDLAEWYSQHIARRGKK